MRRATSFASLAWGWLALAPSSVLSAQPPAAFDRRVAEVVAARWRVDPALVQLDWSAWDSTTRLAADASFQLQGQGFGGWFSVTIRRAAAPTMALRIRAGMEAVVPVAVRPLPAGTMLQLPDIAHEKRVRWGPPELEEAASMIGWEVRRPVREGGLLARPGVVPPRVINAGEPITLIWERSGVAISVIGTALNSARTGDEVRVRIDGRRDRVTGIATSAGTATLTHGGES